MAGEDVFEDLERLEGKRFSAYRLLSRKEYRVSSFVLRFTRVQPDPYAPPSIAEIIAPIPRHLRLYAEWAIPFTDALHRMLWLSLRKRSKKVGEGHSGLLSVPRPSPIVIARSSVVVRGEKIVFRVRIGLPSRRRRILGYEASSVVKNLLHSLSSVLSSHSTRFKEAVGLWRDQESLRRWVEENGFLGFIADGSILPRKCGRCFEPLEGAVPFEAPSSVRREVILASGKAVTGMVVEKGFTVLSGSAFHGKTTILEAIAEGVWNHTMGDGREFVVTRRDAVVVKTEQGRSVSCVDVSSFIHDLPSGVDTSSFKTLDASGATSVAASIQEAVEAGSALILVDEDEAATNIIYEDEVAARLLKWRTVTPLTRLAKGMIEAGLSVILVSQGTSDAYRAATRVLVVEGYRVREATREAKNLVRGGVGGHEEYRLPKPRVLRLPRLVKPRIKQRTLTARNLEAAIDLSAASQLVESTQWRSLEEVAKNMYRFNGRSLREAASEIARATRRAAFEELVGHGKPVPPEMGELRPQDVAFLFNRVPWLC